MQQMQSRYEGKTSRVHNNAKTEYKRLYYVHAKCAGKAEHKRLYWVHMQGYRQLQTMSEIVLQGVLQSTSATLPTHAQASSPW